MTGFAVRNDLPRAVINGFSLPLGMVPAPTTAPQPGYIIAYDPGDEDRPDIYTFHIVVSQDRLAELIRRAFAWLPDEVFPILEVSSCDAYRAIDVFLAAEPITRQEFLDIWQEFEPVFLEECAIAFGANSDEPYVEVFLDNMKGLVVHAPLDMRAEIETMLHSFGLDEVPEIWAATEEDDAGPGEFRNVLAAGADGIAPELDEFVYTLRQICGLELDVDPDANLDDGGRELGATLWWCTAVLESLDAPDSEGLLTIWATAASLTELGMLLDEALVAYPEWQVRDIYTLERVPFDERPDDLADLTPRRDWPQIHLVRLDTEPVEPTRDGDA